MVSKLALTEHDDAALTITEKMEATNIEAPQETVVERYEKKSWLAKFAGSVDTFHRWTDLLLKLVVSGVIIWILWKWVDFVERVIENANCTVPAAVQVALVSGTSVNIIGLLGIMAKYLFPSRKKE